MLHISLAVLFSYISLGIKGDWFVNIGMITFEQLFLIYIPFHIGREYIFKLLLVTQRINKGKLKDTIRKVWFEI